MADNLKEKCGEEKVIQLRKEVNRIRLEFRGNLARVINNKRNKWVDTVAENVIRKQKITLGEPDQIFAHLSRHPIFGLPILMTVIMRRLHH